MKAGRIVVSLSMAAALLTLGLVTGCEDSNNGTNPGGPANCNAPMVKYSAPVPIFQPAGSPTFVNLATPRAEAMRQLVVGINNKIVEYNAAIQAGKCEQADAMLVELQSLVEGVGVQATNFAYLLNSYSVSRVSLDNWWKQFEEWMDSCGAPFHSTYNSNPAIIIS